MANTVNSAMITLADWDGNLYCLPRALLEHFRVPEMTVRPVRTNGHGDHTRVGRRRNAGAGHALDSRAFAGHAGWRQIGAPRRHERCRCVAYSLQGPYWSVA